MKRHNSLHVGAKVVDSRGETGTVAGREKGVFNYINSSRGNVIVVINEIGDAIRYYESELKEITNEVELILYGFKGKE